MGANGTHVTYYRDAEGDARVTAIFSAFERAARHAFATTSAEQLVRVAPVEFGVPIERAITAAETAAADSLEKANNPPKPRNVPLVATDAASAKGKTPTKPVQPTPAS
jgi:hypothetical protein